MPAEVSEGNRTQTLPLPLPDAPVEAPVPVPFAADDPPAGTLPRCANCLTPLDGPFCSQCGQHVADYHRSVWRFVADFFDNTFCWDNKLLRTLGPLFKRPGWLTQEFMAGRRVRYVHPLRLFLFTSAVCLTLLQFNHGYEKARIRVGKNAKPAGVTAHLGTDDDDDEDEDKTPAAAPSPAASVAAAPVTDAPAVSPTAPDASSVAPAASASASPAAPAPPVRVGGEGPTESLGQILHDTIGASLKGDKGKDPKAAEELARRWAKFSDEAQKADGAKKINQEVATNIQQKASWVALAMLPIFAWLMHFAYGRRGGYFFAYLVFSLHYHTFLLLFWTAFLWLSTAVKATHLSFLEVPLLLGFLGPPVYLYLSLQRFYGESRARTIAKTFAIGGLHLLAIVIGVAIAGVGSSLTMK